jgi:hypothetical protein
VAQNEPAGSVLTEILLQHGASVTEPEANSGFTPVHLAAYLPHIEALAVFFKQETTRQIAINVRTPSGATPLHLAARRGHLQVVQLLLQNGADPLARDIKGATPLHYANDSAIQTLLLDAMVPILHDFVSLRDDLCRTLHREQQIENQNSTTSAITQVNAQLKELTRRIHEQEKELNDKDALILQLQRQLSTLQKQESKTTTPSSALCVLCRTHSRDTVVFPCLHALYCSICLPYTKALGPDTTTTTTATTSDKREQSTVKYCPLCKEQIVGIVKMYTAVTTPTTFLDSSETERLQ